MKTDHAIFALLEIIAIQQTQIEALKMAQLVDVRDWKAFDTILKSKRKPEEVQELTTHYAKAFQKLVKGLETIFPRDDFDALVDRGQWPAGLDDDLEENLS